MINTVTKLRKAIKNNKKRNKYIIAPPKNPVTNPQPEPQPVARPLPNFVRLNRPAKGQDTNVYLPQDSLGHVLTEADGKWVIKFPGVIAVIEPDSDLIRIIE